MGKPEEGLLEEGFYVAHLRDENLFCYVHRTEEGFSAAMLNGEEWPVLSLSGRQFSQSPYILPANLEKTEPDKYLKQALDTIEFICTNIGRLHKKQHKLETSLEKDSEN